MARRFTAHTGKRHERCSANPQRQYVYQKFQSEPVRTAVQPTLRHCCQNATVSPAAASYQLSNLARQRDKPGASPVVRSFREAGVEMAVSRAGRGVPCCYSPA